MIQRLQSLWLLIAATFIFLTYTLPFFSGTITKEDSMQFEKLNASYSFIPLVLTAILGVGCVIIIFLFRNRKLQLRLTILACAVSILNIVIYFSEMRKFTNGSLSFTAILYFAIPVLFILAAISIRKDEKLVKSMDQLR